MKNSYIEFLADKFAKLTTNDIDAAQAYKVLSFKRELAKADKERDEKRLALVKETLTDEEVAAIQAAEKAGETVAPEIREKLKKFNEMYAELLKEEVDLKTKKIPYATWHAIVKENKLSLGMVETELMGVLFDEPEE